MNVAEAEHRLRTDYEFYARNCLTIVDATATQRRLKLKRTQQIVNETLERQRAEGRAMRAVVLKARKTGVSTSLEGKITHRYTQRPNHKAVVVAHDVKTAGELFEMSETMYAKLPDRTVGGLVLKPPVVASRRKAEIKLGQPSRAARHAGDLGLNSSLLVDTAGEVQAGRGFTYHSLHLSEVAFWPDAGKLTSLQNSVPDDPDTMIVLETTANGHNFFRRFWRRAEDGLNDYAAIFFPWHDEPAYVRPFISPEERERFVVGDHEFGEAEPGLVELGVTLEQLNWRRWAIENRTNGDLRTFQQEYPENPEEAFLATGRQVFSGVLVNRMIARAERTPVDLGLLDVAKSEIRTVKGREVRVPLEVAWRPRERIDIAPMGQTWWRRWAEPDPGNWPGVEGFDPEKELRPPGQYVTAVDPASGEENETGELAFHAIEVIDHRTLEQVAEWRARDGVDADEVMFQALCAAILYNGAWIAVEKTGGWGLSILNDLVKVYRYARIYRRRAPDQRSEKLERRLGWDTNEKTKRYMIDLLKRLVREGTDGVRSTILAGEFQTYVRDETGKMGPDSDAQADCLMAYGIGQAVGREIPLKTYTTKAPKMRQVQSVKGGY